MLLKLSKHRACKWIFEHVNYIHESLVCKNRDIAISQRHWGCNEEHSNAVSTQLESGIYTGSKKCNGFRRDG